jgi:hypothetical protein
LAQVSGMRIMPMVAPSGATTSTPGRAPAQMLPSASQRMPSAAVGAPVPGMLELRVPLAVAQRLAVHVEHLDLAPMPVSAT